MCAHVYLHNLFYDIRRLCGKDVRAFDVPAAKEANEAFTYTLTKSQAAWLCSQYPELAAALREGVFLWLDGPREVYPL